MDKETIARIAHEVNRIYCTTISDHSQPNWDEAPDWQKKSAIAGVEYLANNPDALPEHSHQSWLRHKESDGWIYGPVKDPEKKEHPCIVAYEELPEAQRHKDAFFHAIVRAALGEKKDV
jgi:hypothetical protein